MKWIACSLFVALGLVACAPTSTPRIRVARDLGCTADETTTVRIDERRWRVSGCGRTAIYLCTYPVRDCWREGEIQPAQPAQPPSD
ncbi:MAG: hypothetical protein KIT84_30355 [Labilithrix sp.]|nr:hypothetical protein [Labilithrix sp.]MCW5815368.1 hypothetical protein [Labilithrix sp.]